MGKKSLEKLYNDLIKNLWNELLFYIPNTDLAKAFIKELKHIDENKIIDKVFVMDKMLGPVEYKKDGKHDILSKNKMLEDSMYLLLKKKRKLEGQEFSFVFSNYFEQAELCFYITNWFHDDLETNTNRKLDMQLYGLFQIQYRAYKKHFEKLIKHFYPKRENLPAGNFNVFGTLEKYFPELIKKYNLDNKVIASIENANTEYRTNAISNKTVETKKIDITIKQQPLITVLEAEQFLLKSVFNIDFEKLINK